MNKPTVSTHLHGLIFKLLAISTLASSYQYNNCYTLLYIGDRYLLLYHVYKTSCLGLFYRIINTVRIGIQKDSHMFQTSYLAI